jgi:gluconolactonase
VLFSDIPNNRIMRFSEDDGHVSVYRQPSMNSNGNTIDREGRLVTCEHSGRRVTRTELDGSITIIADKYNGKKLNSPNDGGCRFRRFDLVHRSSLRHRRLL